MATSANGKREQGKEPSSGKKKKKQRQRGMGVAQLERLLEEDQRKKMRAGPLAPPPPPSYPGSIVPSFPFRPPCHYSLRDPIYAGDAPAVIMDRGSVGFAAGGSQRGFDVRGGADGSGCLWGRGGFGSGQQQLLDPIFNNLVGAPDPRFLHMGVALETSNELYSKPKMMQCFVDDRGYGFKEKPSMDAEELAAAAAVEDGAQINGGYDFLGLNLGDGNESMDEFRSQQGFGSRRRPAGKEVMAAVLMSGRTVTDRRNVVMEYELFPAAAPESCGGDGRRNASCEKKIELTGHEVQMSQESVEASLITVDLSLKL